MRNEMKFKYVVVGAGLAGITIAERIASELDEKVLVIEKRAHIGGNIFDSYNEDGILIHNYGPHTFHTDNKEVFDYMLQFTEWNDYQHRVLSYIDGTFFPIPISLDTINKFYNMDISECEIEDFLNQRRVPVQEIQTSEDVAISQVGYDLYEKFFKYFTVKQWGLSPKELDRSVISRIPFRKNRDTRYFTDKYQGNPKHGYTKMCENMLAHPNIKIMLKTDYKEVIQDVDYDLLVYTGPIDYFFDYEFGKLLYRSIRFQFETYDIESYQQVVSSRYPTMDYDYSRITEFKKMTGQNHPKTTILKEYPCFGEDPYYPYPTNDQARLYEKYAKKANMEEKVLFVGRLAEYKYYDMDDVIAAALACFEKKIISRER